MTQFLLQALMVFLACLYCRFDERSDFTDACRDHGYWQTGQTRVICSVEAPKK